MGCPPLLLASVLLALPPLASPDSATDESPPAPAVRDIELAPGDAEAITMEVLQRYPLASSSPGIKAAYVQSRLPAAEGEVAHVIFHPHAETRGIKVAFDVSCTRDNPVAPWSCAEVELRRYIKLDSQDFEVRVTGNLEMDGVLALTEATRPFAASAVANGAAADTALVVHPGNGGYLVSWGSRAGYAAVLVQAHLRNGGNPANSGDWYAEAVPIDD